MHLLIHEWRYFGTKLAGEETDLAAKVVTATFAPRPTPLYIFINIYTLTIGWLLAFFRPVVELLACDSRP